VAYFDGYASFEGFHLVRGKHGTSDCEDFALFVYGYDFFFSVDIQININHVEGKNVTAFRDVLGYVLADSDEAVRFCCEVLSDELGGFDAEA